MGDGRCEQQTLSEVRVLTHRSCSRRMSLLVHVHLGILHYPPAAQGQVEDVSGPHTSIHTHIHTHARTDARTLSPSHPFYLVVSVLRVGPLVDTLCRVWFV